MNRFLVFAAAVLFFVACDSPGPEPQKPVRLAYLQNDLHQLACWIALEKGFFNQEGVAVEVEGIFKAGPEEMTAFAAGSLDIGYVGQAPATMAAANKTARIVMLAQVNKGGSALVVATDSPYWQISQLQSKTVAVPGYAQVQDFLLRKALRNQGLENGAVTVMVLKPPEMISALRSGDIDAFVAWEPYPAQAAAMKAGRTLARSQDIWPGHPCCSLVADLDFVAARPDAVKKILRAHVRATEFIRAHEAEAVAVAVAYTGLEEGTVRSGIRNITYDYTPSIDGALEYVTFLDELQYLTVPDPRAFTESFINTTFLQAVTHP